MATVNLYSKMNWFGLPTLFAQFPTLSSLYHLPYISYHWDSFMRTYFIFREFSDDRKLISSALVLLLTVVQSESGQSWNCFNIPSVSTCCWHNTLYFSSMVTGIANKKRNHDNFKCLNLWNRPCNLLQQKCARAKCSNPTDGCKSCSGANDKTLQTF